MHIPNHGLKILNLTLSENNVFSSALKSLRSSGEDIQLNIKYSVIIKIEGLIIFPKSLEICFEET